MDPPGPSRGPPSGGAPGPTGPVLHGEPASESWQEFLRTGTTADGLPAQRETVSGATAADRKRRLTLQGDNRRRSPVPAARRVASDYSPNVVSATAERPLPELPDPARDGRIGQMPDVAREVPRWQSDQEVSKCPICGTHFGIFYRRHHCRKCGRVVCANCSPHRITIPRQFIVQQPSNPSDRLSSPPVIDLTDDAPVSVQGSAEVRVCNPCVPDPSYDPPPLYHRRASEVNWRQLQAGRPQPMGDGSDERRRQRSNTDVPSPQASRASPRQGPRATPPHLPQHISQHRRFSHVFRDHGFSPSRSLLHSRSSSHSSVTPGHNPQPGYRSMLDIDSPPVTPQRPVLREEDECPVCHNELPPLGPDGDTTARESHINDCIMENFATSSPAPAPSTLAQSTTASRPSHTEPGESSSGPTASASTSTSIGASTSPSHAPVQHRSHPHPHRPKGMLTYHATEKDCVNAESGEAQECVICFEEFTVGDEMGRLECLCKFHRACIRQWWDKKGVGACPVHRD
ncbi:MAG: hypothetical protein M1819_005493 [Sarea resinae]|nr:MAG: hypothetical protein M1819_005493 [Sarea resinae]